VQEYGNKKSNTQSSKLNSKVNPLDALLGKWKSVGKTIASPSEPVVRIVGTDSYKWMAGGFFLVHNAKVTVGKDTVEVLEMIGTYDTSSKTYPMRAFDNTGNFSTMKASVGVDGIWTFVGKSQRATLTISKDGKTMKAKWKRSKNAKNWEHWMDMKFTRIT
jgi:hypothetical protein